MSLFYFLTGCGAAARGLSLRTRRALWFTLQERLAQPFTALRTDALAGVDLEAFDVLVLPDGRYDTLSEDALTRVEDWIRRGGALLGYAGGAQFLAHQDLGASYAPPDTGQAPADTLAAIQAAVDAEVSADVALPPVSSPSADVPELAVPGAFLRARVDTTHWLAFGYDAAEMALLTQHVPLRLSVAGANPVTYAADNLEVSGFTWPVLTRRTYGEQAYAAVDRVGTGRIILLAEDPVFRVWADGPIHLLTNAIYLGARGYRDASGYR